MVPRRVRYAWSALALAATLGPGCVPGSGTGAGPPAVTATDFRPAQIRQPALSVRVTLRGEWTERERRTWRQDYEGLLLEGFNARAVVVKDVQITQGKTVDRRAALARARDVGADHAILVEASAARETVTVCQETGRPRRGEALVWRQDVEVLRATDGAIRLQVLESPALVMIDADVDCQTGRARRQDPGEVMRHAVEKLLSRLLGS